MSISWITRFPERELGIRSADRARWADRCESRCDEACGESKDKKTRQRQRFSGKSWLEKQDLSEARPMTGKGEN